MTKGTRSAAFLEKWPEAAVNCNRQGEGGGSLVVCLDPGELLPGEYLTASGSEWPNGASVCSLWQVLETGAVPKKYFLSKKACEGILRRAVKRGKALPTILLRALQAVAGVLHGQARQGAKTL